MAKKKIKRQMKNMEKCLLKMGQMANFLNKQKAPKENNNKKKNNNPEKNE